MGIFDKLLSAGVSEAASGLGDLAKDLRESIKGKEIDPNKQLELTSKLVEIQGEINKIEANHRTIFVAGWRPFIGWVCGVAVAWAFVLQPMFSWGAAVFFGYSGIFPEPDLIHLMAILAGMLGMGGLRTFEKTRAMKNR